MNILNDIEKTLVTQEELDAKVQELADKIAEDYEDKNPVFLGILKGSFVFMADLMRNINRLYGCVLLRKTFRHQRRGKNK